MGTGRDAGFQPTGGIGLPPTSSHLRSLPFSLSASLSPDQFCISVQHRQDPDDKITSLHHVGDDSVQVSDGHRDRPQHRHTHRHTHREKGGHPGHLPASGRGPLPSPQGARPGSRERRPGARPRLQPRPRSPRKAVKATLVLLPLLGTTYMLFFVNPGEDDLSQIVFIYFNSFLQSFQVGCTSRSGPRRAS